MIAECVYLSDISAICLSTLELTHSDLSNILSTESDQKPTLPQLLNFPGKSGKINIPERIGTNYRTFGILLLNDENGTKVASITKEESTMTDISLKILSKWLQGEGTQPLTWNTVIKVLTQSNLTVLADQVASVITP